MATETPTNTMSPGAGEEHHHGNTKATESTTHDARSARKLPLFSKLGRNTYSDSRKISMKEFYRTPYPSHKKKPPPHYRFHYDHSIKGWREVQKESATSRWSKAKGAVRVGGYFIGIRKKPNTVLNIDVKSLVKATAQNRILNASQKMSDETDDSLQKAITEPQVIPKPFARGTSQNHDGVWTYPVTNRTSDERTSNFKWEKPRTERKKLVESASRYQAQYLQKLLDEKERNMRLVTQQLIKCNKDNVQLLRELERYRGKNYDELYKENMTLKEQVARTSRENSILTGQLRRDHNKVLQRWTREKTVT